MKHAGFGFHNISDNFDSTVIITKEVGQLIDKTRILQKQSNFEQPFAILGTLQIDEENNPIIMFDKFIEISMLYGFYGGLLPEKQNLFLKAYYEDDCSLSEIAEQYGMKVDDVKTYISEDMIRTDVRNMKAMELLRGESAAE